MKTANLIADGSPIIQIEYEVSSSQGKNYRIGGTAYMPMSWNNKNEVGDRDFIVKFDANWECETVLRFFGEDYEEDGSTDSYYQTGSVRDLINMSRALFLIHRLLETELGKTGTYMDKDDNEYAKTFNILDGCEIEIKESE